jgi:exonuclease SbcD
VSGRETVRIIHTSDWHIGRRFDGRSLEGDQRAFLRWLAEVVASRAVDLVVVAGDVYDRSLPAEEAVALLDDALDELRGAGAQVAMISGNHDSARRLGFGSHRQALGGVHVFADDRRTPVPWVFSARGVEVAVLPVPFLDPWVVTQRPPGADGPAPRRTHQGVLRAALEAGRRGLAGSPGRPSIAVAHAFVAGASVSDSERTLAVGGTDAVDRSLFDGFDYVALGHLHRPQCLGADHIAYSGSPLPYSYSEDHPKSVRLLEVKADGLASVEDVRVPVGRPVTTLTGRLDELLTDPALGSAEQHWVAAVLTDDVAQVQPMERLHRRFAFATTVRYRQVLHGARRGPGAEGDDVEHRPPEDVVLAFLAELRGRDASLIERALVTDAIGAALAGAEA